MVTLAIVASAQTITPRSPFSFNFDYSRFRYSETEGYLEVYYAIYPSLVTLRPDSGVYRGGVEIRTTIRNEVTDSVLVQYRALIPVTVRDTSTESLRRAIVAKLDFVLPNGKYSLTIHGQEARNPERRDSSTVSFAIESLGDSVRISDVDLCSNIVSSDKKDDPFYRNTFEVIPNPSLFFGTAYAPVVFTYTELYNLPHDSVFAISARIVDGRGTILRERTRQRRFNVRNAVDVSTLNVTGIQSGKYHFYVVVSDTLGHEVARTEKPIFLYNPGVAAAPVSVTSARAAELAGMTSDELEEEFREARYIATDEQIRLFDNLTTTLGRREFLAKFWNDVESGRTGKTDITRASYLARVATANQRYHAMSKDGWHSDRGRVYILYGEPDEIQRYPSQEDSKPYEVWHYYHIENGVEFDFVDRNGFGEYVLVNSTKRGELQDDSWQRYLH